MWKVKCDCCGTWQECANQGEPQLPADWRQVKWNCEIGMAEGGQLNLCGFCYGRFAAGHHLANIRLNFGELERSICEAMDLINSDDPSSLEKEIRQQLERAQRALEERKPV